MPTHIVLTPAETNMLHQGYARQEVCIAVYARVFGEPPSEVAWVLRQPPAKVRAVVTAVEIEDDRLRNARAQERRQQREAADAEIAAAVPTMTANELLDQICMHGGAELLHEGRGMSDLSHAIEVRCAALTSPDAGSLRVSVNVRDAQYTPWIGAIFSAFPTGVVTGLTITDGELRFCILLDDGRRLTVPPHTFTGVDGKPVLR